MRANEAEEKQSRTEQECQEVKAEAGRQRALVEEEAHSQRLMVIAKQHDLQLAADEAQAGLAAKEEEVGRLQEEVEGLSQQVIELKVEASRQFEQSDAEMRAFRQVYDSKCMGMLDHATLRAEVAEAEVIRLLEEEQKLLAEQSREKTHVALFEQQLIECQASLSQSRDQIQLLESLNADLHAVSYTREEEYSEQILNLQRHNHDLHQVNKSEIHSPLHVSLMMVLTYIVISDESPGVVQEGGYDQDGER